MFRVFLRRPENATNVQSHDVAPRTFRFENINQRQIDVKKICGLEAKGYLLFRHIKEREIKCKITNIDITLTFFCVLADVAL